MVIQLVSSLVTKVVNNHTCLALAIQKSVLKVVVISPIFQKRKHNLRKL